MKQGECMPSLEVKKKLSWWRYTSDSLLAIAGVALFTGVIMVAHPYRHNLSISLSYLLVIIALASTRGRYAAIMAALLASFSFDFFIAPPLSTFSFTKLEDLLDPLAFLLVAILTGSLTATLRHRAEQARSREREARLLSEQAQELASLQERQRLALELHDSVSQTIYSISLGSHTAREALESDPSEAISLLEYVISLSEAGLAEMRALIFELRPESLATEGLIAALTKQVIVLRTRYKLTVDAQLCEEPALSLERKHTLYRIAREALHNIVKHAHASTVLLRLNKQDDELILEVRDDGKGFEPTKPFPGHLGLRSIQERVAHLGGTCSLASAPSQGTCLCVCLPIYDEPGLAVEAYKEVNDTDKWSLPYPFRVRSYIPPKGNQEHAQ